MKKITIPLVIVLLCSAFVLAAYASVEYLGSSGDYKVTYYQTIRKGWNLLPADLGGWSITSDTPEAEVLQKVKAYYVYFPIHNKYAHALGGFNDQEYQQLQSNKPYLQSSAGWYYVTDDIILSYIAENGGGMPKLYKGWNLLAIGPSLSVLNDDVAAINKFPTGDCEVQKAYLWDSYEQMWESIGELDSIHDSLDELADDEAVGVGIAIKVKDSCQLGIGSGTITTPPALPN